MKIWEIDDNNASGLYRANSANSVQDEINREATSSYGYGPNANSYSPYGPIDTTPIGADTFPIMSSIYGPTGYGPTPYGPHTYAQPRYGQPAYGPMIPGPQPMYGPQSMYGPQPTYGPPAYGRPSPFTGNPQPQGPFSPILPADFMKERDEDEQEAHPGAEMSMLGPTLLQQQMMLSPKQLPPEQSFQQQPPPPSDVPTPSDGGAAKTMSDSGQPIYASTMLSPTPATGNLVTRETDKLKKQNRKLLMGVLLLSLFILGAAVGLIVLTVALEPAKATPVSTTMIKFTMTRLDMTYGQELTDKMTYTYLETERRFCDTISSFYLKGAFTVQYCKAIHFSSGSVVANLEISIINNDKTSEQVFLYVASILVAKSDADVSTKPIEASTIKQVSP